MAGTSHRTRTLLPVVLALLAVFGGELPSATYRRGAGTGRLWQCPECGRVERVLLRRPRCSGNPRNTHDVIDAEPAEDEGLTPSDNLLLFD